MIGDGRVSLSRSTVSGHEALSLASRGVRAIVLPSLGGRVWELTDQARARQWIWHRKDVPLARVRSGAVYDDVWAGGWEELFPNDAPGSFQGRDLSDHGEWWTLDWTVEEAQGGVEGYVRLTAETRIRNARCVKELRLRGDADDLVVSYRIESREPEPFHFLFKQHLPVALSDSCRLVLPGGRVTVVDPSFGTLLPGPGPFDWPILEERGKSVDLSVVPLPSATDREFVYVDRLADGWCGVDDLESGACLRMSFDHRQLPCVWLFLSYGGWRSCYTAVLEPCTNMPKDLATAVQRGRSARLEAGGVFETQVTVSLRGLGGGR